MVTAMVRSLLRVLIPQSCSANRMGGRQMQTFSWTAILPYPSLSMQVSLTLPYLLYVLVCLSKWDVERTSDGHRPMTLSSVCRERLSRNFEEGNVQSLRSPEQHSSNQSSDGCKDCRIITERL